MTAVLAAVFSSLLTAFLIRALSVSQEVTRHNREIAELNEDLRRWARDADRDRGDTLRRIIAKEAPRGLSLRDVSEGFRERWRNEASGALRSFWRIVESEGRLHRLVRIKEKRWPGLELPVDVMELLETWREPTVGDMSMWSEVDDPARADWEPELADFETSGCVSFPRRRQAPAT